MDLGYWEAWGLWLAGTKLENLSMYGIPMLWWARAGKLLQFAGGAVVVLDLLGPERFRKASRHVATIGRAVEQSSYWYWFKGIALYVGLVFTLWLSYKSIYETWWMGLKPSRVEMRVGITTTLAIAASSMLLGAVVWYFEALAKLLAVGRHHNAAKWIAFMLVCVGFHFDMLAS